MTMPDTTKHHIPTAQSQLTPRLVKVAEYVWKGLFQSELRINVAPGETKDIRSEMREKYQYLGRTLM